MKLRPIYDRIVVKRKDTETVSAGGIVMVFDEDIKEPEGTIIAVGHEVSISLGDSILFNKTAGTEVRVDGEDLLVMREDDVIAVLS